MTTHKILVPVDFSDESKHSIKQALLLKEKNSEIHVVLILKSTNNYTFIDSSIIKETSLRDLHFFTKHIFNNTIPDFIKLKVKIGNINNIIIKSHKKKSYDLIIVNKSIKDKNNEYLFTRSVIKSLVNTITCNIYTFTSKITNNTQGRILIPIEACREHTKHVNEAIQIAKQNNMGVIIVGILNSNISLPYSLIYQKATKINKCFIDNNISCEKLIYINTAIDIQEAVEKTIKDKNASLIIVPSDNTWVTNDPCISSLGKFLIYNSDIPMYSVMSKGNCLVADLLDSFRKKEIVLDSDYVEKTHLKTLIY